VAQPIALDPISATAVEPISVSMQILNRVLPLIKSILIESILMKNTLIHLPLSHHLPSPVRHRTRLQGTKKKDKLIAMRVVALMAIPTAQ